MLADPTRRSIVQRLIREEATASALAAELAITRQAVSKHLAALDREGLVESERRGRETRHRLAPDRLAGAGRWIVETGAARGARLGRLGRRHAGGR